MTIREMDAVNFGGVPNFGQQFNKYLIDQELNQAVADFLMASGNAPRLIDRYVNVPVTTLLDFVLPADLVAVTRMEYQQAPTFQTTVTSGPIAQGVQTVTLASLSSTNGQNNITVGTVLAFDSVASGKQEQVEITALNSVTKQVTGFFSFTHNAGCVVVSQTVQPYPLRQLTPDQFDRASGNGYPGLTVNSLGLPSVFREPIGTGTGVLCTRFYQAIGSSQVANGDSLNINYSSYGTQMVNNTDVAPVPVEFQRAIIFGASVELWKIKADEDQSLLYEKRFTAWCRRAMGYHWELPGAGTFGFEDEVGTFGADEYVQW